jgi:TolB protein
LQKFLSKSWLLSLVCAIAAISTPSHAQMQIEISGVGQSLFPIAVPSFMGETNLPAKVTDVSAGRSCQYWQIF